MDDYAVSSNRESGDGRYDIMLKSPDIRKAVIIFELKAADSYRSMETAAHTALTQIKEKHYGEGLSRDGYSSLLCYGIAFYKKNCWVVEESCQI